MYIQRFSNIRGFGEYYNVSSDRIEAQRIYTPTVVSSVKDIDEVITQIFAPNPVTGIPRSDLGLLLSKDTRPEVSQYIRQSLLRVSKSPTTLPSADMALDCAPQFGESIDTYVKRLRELTHPNTSSK